MARYTGPKVKISRREGTDVFDTPKWNKRPFPPGQHGPTKGTGGRRTDYGKQLREKQKAKLMYGLLERQFRNLFERAKKMEGDAGQNLLKLLEMRLDNVIYRAGLAKTRRLARQLVNHGHFGVNKRRTDIPSYVVTIGEVINVKSSKLKTPYWKNLAESKEKPQLQASWLKTDWNATTVTITSEPLLTDLPQNIETKLIVEFYSR